MDIFSFGSFTIPSSGDYYVGHLVYTSRFFTVFGALLVFGVFVKIFHSTVFWVSKYFPKQLILIFVLSTMLFSTYFHWISFAVGRMPTENGSFMHIETIEIQYLRWIAGLAYLLF
jgi:hypothetical protein